MSNESEKRAIKDELVRDRIQMIENIGAATGKTITGKARERLHRETEEMARRVVAGEASSNRESYYHRRG